VESFAKKLYGNGTPGLLTMLAEVQLTIKNLMNDVNEMKEHGTHPSGLALARIHEHDVAQDEALKALQEWKVSMEAFRSARNLQFIGLAVSSTISLAGVIVMVIMRLAGR
jgi:hypothetical protein